MSLTAVTATDPTTSCEVYWHKFFETAHCRSAVTSRCNTFRRVRQCFAGLRLFEFQRAIDATDPMFRTEAASARRPDRRPKMASEDAGRRLEIAPAVCPLVVSECRSVEMSHAVKRPVADENELQADGRKIGPAPRSWGVAVLASDLDAILKCSFFDRPPCRVIRPLSHRENTVRSPVSNWDVAKW